MAKKRSIGVKLMKKILMDSTLKSDTKHPLSIIADMHEPNFMEMRAIELIGEARNIIENKITFHSSLKDADSDQIAMEEYHVKIRQAISLLALARAERGAYEVERKTP